MPFTIIRQDITKMDVDAIVNAANSQLMAGGGVCGAIFAAAGAKELTEACSTLAPVPTGKAAITPGFKLPAKYVIHAVGPIYSQWSPDQNRELLYSAYTSSLELADKNHCKSIAFPLISSGIYGYPKQAALEVAAQAITDFLKDHDLDVYLAVFDSATLAQAKQVLGDAARYVDNDAR